MVIVLIVGAVDMWKEGNLLIKVLVMKLNYQGLPHLVFLKENLYKFRC
jgi:hypothetical protein